MNQFPDIGKTPSPRNRKFEGSWKYNSVRRISTILAAPKNKSLALLLAGLGLLVNCANAEEEMLSEAIQSAFATLENGNPDAAIEIFSEVIESAPENVDALLGKAMAYAALERHSFAFLAYDAVVQHEPDNAFAWNGRGLAAFNLEDFDQALFSFERSTVNQPVNGFFYESMAWALMCQGDFGRAIESAKKATLMYNRKGESTIYPILIAYFAYFEKGDLRNAQRTLSYAARNKPRDSWPAPVIDYLTGIIDANDLISYVSNTAEETEAHTYIGLDLRTKSLEEPAMKHLSWVSRNGDTRVFEYTLARAINLQNRVAMRTP